MHYPKPSAIGGTIIRKVIQNFKRHAFALPITEPIYIATSGGVDSMVLAHLIATYGRKVVSPAQITLLHFDHQWRKESATVEKKAVQKLAKQLGVSFQSVKLAQPGKKSPSSRTGKNSTSVSTQNAEQDARQKRNEFYFSQKKARSVFTAHHQDDVAETIFWRFLRGEFAENREGILFQDDQVLRPFLQVSKEELYAYAKAENVPFFEDPTNYDPESQMRAFLRQDLFPLLQKRFPKLKETLARYSQESLLKKALHLRQNDASASERVSYTLEQLTSKLNRVQKNEITAALQTGLKKRSKKITLPGGVVLTTESVQAGKARKTRFLIEILDESIPV